ncbi:MAG: hypothetical protein ACI9EB_000389, partial [Pseudomonas sp.]
QHFEAIVEGSPVSSGTLRCPAFRVKNLRF